MVWFYLSQQKHQSDSFVLFVVSFVISTLLIGLDPAYLFMVFYLTYWVMGFCLPMAIISHYPITH